MQLSSATQIDYYEKNADEYRRSTVELDMSRIYQRVLHELNPGAHILDAGCGSGRDTKAFLQRGYVVTAFDGSPQMADFASKYTGRFFADSIPSALTNSAFQRLDSREARFRGQDFMKIYCQRLTIALVCTRACSRWSV
jgi:SAM-dependent methyltransferase